MKKSKKDKEELKGVGYYSPMDIAPGEFVPATRNQKYLAIKEALLTLIKEDYGEDCETRDTVDFPDILDNPKHNRCPVCLVYEKLEELYEAIDLDPDDL